jgi:predicted RecB family nuclease
MAQELTERFLKSEKVFLEKQSQPVFIEALEQEYSAEIEISVRGEMKKVRLRGFIDRIDRIGETIRIIDYKSGKVDSKSVDFPTQKNDCENVAKAFATKKHILQLSLYAYLYHHKHGVIPQSSIISFISGNNEPFTLDTKKLSLEEVIEEFPNYIGEVLNSVYDVEEAFEHDSSAYFSFCQYCD